MIADLVAEGRVFYQPARKKPPKIIRSFRDNFDIEHICRTLRDMSHVGLKGSFCDHTFIDIGEEGLSRITQNCILT